MSETQGDDSTCGVVTSTTIKERGSGGVIVAVKAETDHRAETLPMKVEIAVDDELAENQCLGTANKWIRCDPIDLHNDDN